MIDQGELSQSELVRPTWARWVTRVLLLASGILMIFVSLSQPKVINKLQSGFDAVSVYLPGQDSVRETASTQARTAVPTGADLSDSQTANPLPSASAQN